MYDGLISVGYHASTDEHVHYSSIVHDYETGAGVLINRDMELCQRYQIKAQPNATIADKVRDTSHVTGDVTLPVTSRYR